MANVSVQELKKRACEAIDKNRDKIIAIGDSIFEEPELGYKEFKTAEKVKKAFDEMGFKYQDSVAITGVIAPLKGKKSLAKVSIMGELDAVVAPEHRCANPETGGAHSCGHNAMIASIVGVGYALAGTGIMEELGGDISIMAVPAEEFVEIEYRNQLIEEGKISLLGGKQEFVKLGVMDDIDIMIMQHTGVRNEGDPKAVAGGGGNGFTGKLIKYIGKAAHSGGAPHLGVNALNAATLGLQGIAMQRETFKDQDHVRIHPIITKGGDLVNVVPEDVRIETYVRAANLPAIEDACMKVDRALKAGADAMGAEVVIKDLPGYLPPILNDELLDVVFANMKDIMGEDCVQYTRPAGTGSTDQGDISQLMPSAHPYFLGAKGVGHSSNYEIGDKEIAYIDAAKTLVTTAIDLLYGDAEKALTIKANHKPALTKEEYLSKWCKL